MIAARINGTTNVRTAPRGWNEERVGRRNPLAIRIEGAA
jgi:hypothetical protein